MSDLGEDLDQEVQRPKRLRKEASTDTEGGVESESEGACNINKSEFERVHSRLDDVTEQLKEVVGSLKAVSISVNVIGATVNEIKAKVDNHDAILSTLREQVEKNEDATATLNMKVEESIRKMQKALEDVRVMEGNLEKMEERMIDQEARSRRNNLLFFNVAESAEGEREDCGRVIRDLISKLGVTDRELPMQRAHRLGPRPRHNIGRGKPFPRPIIVNFLDFQDKELVRRSSGDLGTAGVPGKRVTVSEDFPIQIRKARETLVNEMKECKRAGKKATIAYPARLVVDGEVVRVAPVVSARPQ